MLLIIFSTTNFPVVRLHGFCAIGVVLLGEEVLLVGSDLHEVGFAGLDHAGYHHELRAVLELTLRERRSTFYRLAEIQTVALVGGGRSYAVGSQEHLLAGVLTALAGFGQSAGNVVNTGGIGYTCHVVRAMAQNDSRLRRSMDLSPCSHSSVRKHCVGLRPEGRAL